MPRPAHRAAPARPRRPARPTALPAAESVTVDSLGIRGDGVARGQSGRLYIAGALPGERVRVQPTDKRSAGWVAELLAVEAPSPDRQQPPCGLAGTCGGCQLQHVAPAPYVALKQGWVARALAAQGLDPAVVRPLLVLPAATRRRATLALRLAGRATALGFNARRSHRLVPLEACGVLAPALTALLEPLRLLFASLPPQKEPLDLHLTALAEGVQAVLTGPLPPGPLVLQDLADGAAALDLAELWHRPEPGTPPVPLALRRRLHLQFGPVAVPLPPAAFLQASAEGEAALQRLVAEAIGAAPGPRHLIDLFAGLGTLGLAAARPGDRLELIDSDGPAIAALKGVLPRHPGFTVQARDLHREPLPPARFAGADAVIFDPPRAGTGAQIAALAEASVPVLAAVSCNPVSFAQDARRLVEAGWRLDWVQPVDQFAFAAHVELAARFSKGREGP